VENFLSIQLAGNVFVLLSFCAVLCLPAAAEQLAAGSDAGVWSPASVEYIYIVNRYEYKVPAGGERRAHGQAVCGTRCNALSADYRNYLDPDGWRLERVASNEPLVVKLPVSSFRGTCTCYADKYRVIVNELYMVKPGTRRKP